MSSQGHDRRFFSKGNAAAPPPRQGSADHPPRPSLPTWQAPWAQDRAPWKPGGPSQAPCAALIGFGGAEDQAVPWPCCRRFNHGETEVENQTLPMSPTRTSQPELHRSAANNWAGPRQWCGLYSLPHSFRRSASIVFRRPPTISGKSTRPLAFPPSGRTLRKIQRANGSRFPLSRKVTVRPHQLPHLGFRKRPGFNEFFRTGSHGAPPRIRKALTRNQQLTRLPSRSDMLRRLQIPGLQTGRLWASRLATVCPTRRQGHHQTHRRPPKRSRIRCQSALRDNLFPRGTRLPGTDAFQTTRPFPGGELYCAPNNGIPRLMSRPRGSGR